LRIGGKSAAAKRKIPEQDILDGKWRPSAIEKVKKWVEKTRMNSLKPRTQPARRQ
jgi:hypothetical protein